MLAETSCCQVRADWCVRTSLETATQVATPHYFLVDVLQYDFEATEESIGSRWSKEELKQRRQTDLLNPEIYQAPNDIDAPFDAPRTGSRPS